MKQFNGFESKRSGGQEALPAGGYVAKIIGAKEKNYDWGSTLEIGFDICEGEYKGFFDAQYKAAGDNAKWKGILRQRIPDENNQYFEGQKRSFGNTIWAVEESNSGYHWDWDETKLKGKTVGVLFRNYEYDIDGRQGWSTECCAFTSVEDIRSGKFKMPKDKPLKNATAAAQKPQEAAFESIPDSELPF